MKLTEKQKQFCDEYLKDLNATAAAKRAGYKDPNFGRQLLTKTNVSEYVSKRMLDREKRTEITQDRVLKELASIGFADIADFAKVEQFEVSVPTGEYREDGSPVIDRKIVQGVVLADTDAVSADKRGAVAGIKQGTNGIEVKLNDKVKALELLGKHLGMFKDEQDANVPVTVVINYDYGSND